MEVVAVDADVEARLLAEADLDSDAAVFAIFDDARSASVLSYHSAESMRISAPADARMLCYV